MLNRVIRDVRGGDLAELPLLFNAINHAGGHDGGVLDKFLRVFGTDAQNAFGDGTTETGDDFFL